MKIFAIVLMIFSLNAIGGERVLHPDFPVVKGQYQMTPEWAITLDQPHNRRVEDGSLVLWRPGFTVWINVWGNDNNESIKARLKWITADSSPNAYEIKSQSLDFGHRYTYRLNETENDNVTYTYNGFVLGLDSHVQATVYFDSEGDLKEAKSVVESIEYAQH